MIVENQRDQSHCEREAQSDPPAELEPYGIESYLFPYPLPLNVPPVQIIRQYGDDRTQENLNHGLAPVFMPLSGCPASSQAERARTLPAPAAHLFRSYPQSPALNRRCAVAGGKSWECRPTPGAGLRSN